MKIIYSLVCFLTAGILGFSDARDEMEALCAKNSGPRAYKALQSGMVDIQTCFVTTINDWAIQVQRSGGQMDAAFELYCDRIGTLKNCAKRFANLIKTCLEPGQYDLIDMSYNMSASMLDFGCENSKLFEAALNSHDKFCLNSKLEKMAVCTKEISTSHNFTIPKQPASHVESLGALSKIKVDFNSKDCREIQHAEECTVRILAECEDKTFSKILDSLWKHINDNIPCNNLTKSAASPAGVVNILLLFFAAIAISL